MQRKEEGARRKDSTRHIPADLFFSTDTSGESAPTPITRGATLRLTHTDGHYHIDHHTDHTTYGASAHGELGALANAIAKVGAHLPALLPHVLRVWFVVDATADTHLLLHIARQPLHKATATSLGTQALLLSKALRSLPPYVQLHIVKQESGRHQYGNGKGSTPAHYALTDPPGARPGLQLHTPPTDTPQAGALSDPRPRTGGRSLYLTRQSIPLPQPHQTSRPRAGRHGQPSAHSRDPGETESPPLPLGATPACVPAHPQKPRIQHLREQLSFLNRVAGLLARKHIHVRCPCDHTTPEDWEYIKICPLPTGRDKLVGWSAAETIQQHETLPAHRDAH